MLNKAANRALRPVMVGKAMPQWVPKSDFVNMPVAANSQNEIMANEPVHHIYFGALPFGPLSLKVR